MVEKLLYKIKGKEYLLMEDLVLADSIIDYKKKVKKCRAIEQGIKELKKSGMFSSGYIVMKVLVPVNNINKWNDASLGANE